MKKILFLFILTIISTYLNAQDIYWATKVDSISSEYSNEEAAAVNILGVPNVDIRGRWSSYAWAVAPNSINTEGVETAYIDVSFGGLIEANQIAIFESFNPGAISEILILGDREWERVYVDTSVMARSGFVTFDGKVDSNLKDTLSSVKKDLNIFMKDEEFQAKEGYNILNVFLEEPKEIITVRIVLNLLTIDGWNQIDAVALTNSDIDIDYPEVNIADRSLITERKPRNLGERINTLYSEINPVIDPNSKELYFSRSFYDNRYYEETQHIYVADYVMRSSPECYRRKDIRIEDKELWNTSAPFNEDFNNVMPNEIFCFSADGNTMYLNNLYTKVNKDRSDSIFGRETSGISISKKDTSFWKEASGSQLEEIQLDTSFYKQFKINKQENVLLMISEDSVSNEKLLYANVKTGKNWLREPMLVGSLSEQLDFSFSHHAEEPIHLTLHADTSNIDSLKLGNVFWSAPAKLEITDFKNTSKYISVYVTPNEETMFLALEDEASIGKRDLYVSTKTGENQWGKPQNLGKVVNTLNDEASPFLDDDGISLYFSSAGHSGYGEMDIFVTRKIGDNWDEWTTPRNIGSTINTGGEENHFIIDPNTRIAYFSSTTKTYGCNDMSDLFDVQMSKPIDLTFSGRVLNFRTKKGISEAEVTLKALDKDGKEAFRQVTLVSDKYDGKFSIKLNEFVDANKLSKFALIVRKNFHTQTNNKGDSIIFDIADIDKSQRRVDISQDLYMKTKSGGSYIPPSKSETNKAETLDDKIILRGDTVFITKTVHHYETVVVEKTVSGIMDFPIDKVDACDVILHKGDLYLIPEIGIDSMIRLDYLRTSFHKEFGFNKFKLTDNDPKFDTMILDLISKLKIFKSSNLTVHILASASKIPRVASNQRLAEQRADAAKAQIRRALKENNIPLTAVSFEDHTMIQGPRYNPLMKKEKYREYQYIKIWLVSCGKRDAKLKDFIDTE